MTAFQPESGPIVIEVCILPTRGVVTTGALQAEIPVVRVILAVTGHALRGCALELPPDVAGFTSRQGGMLPG